jgi:hypothetical protein
MFTFYDNLYGCHEKSWNLCWNEILGIFTTFYSWIPSDMENIDNIPFSFNRDAVKAIGKLGVSDHGNDYSDGVTLSNNVMDVIESRFDEVNHGYTRPSFEVHNKDLTVYYFNKQGERQTYEFASNSSIDGVTTLHAVQSDPQFIGFLHLDNRELPDGKARYHIEYELMRDNQGNHKIFEIKNVKLAIEPVDEIIKSDVRWVEVSYLTLKEGFYVSDLLSELYYRNSNGIAYADTDLHKKAPDMAMYEVTNVKIPDTQLKNKEVVKRLLDEYGPDWPIGNDTSRSRDTAYHCGYLRDINLDSMESVPDGESETFVDPTSRYHGIMVADHWLLTPEGGHRIHTHLPIFKNKQGKRLMLPKHLQVNPDKIVRYLNIKAQVFIEAMAPDGNLNANEAYFNQFANGDSNVCMIDTGYFESQVAITTSFNLGLLSTDFWKHG